MKLMVEKKDWPHLRSRIEKKGGPTNTVEHLSPFLNEMGYCVRNGQIQLCIVYNFLKDIMSKGISGVKIYHRSGVVPLDDVTSVKFNGIVVSGEQIIDLGHINKVKRGREVLWVRWASLDKSGEQEMYLKFKGRRDAKA